MIVALTGGIGSGKSYICGMLKQFGISVYDCDSKAKQLMLASKELQDNLNALIGKKVFDGKQFNKAMLAEFLLQSSENKQAVNDVVHPFVARNFEQSGHSWIESAILFESGFYKRIHIDKVVCITAPVEVRVKRIMQRDNLPESKAREWIAKQMPQEEVVARSDFNIVCDGTEAQKKQQITELLSALQLLP